MLRRQHGPATATNFVDTQRKRDMCYRPRAGRVEEEVRQARAVELIAQKRLLDLHMRAQVCASCCSIPCTAGDHALVSCCCQRPCLHSHGKHVTLRRHPILHKCLITQLQTPWLELKASTASTSDVYWKICLVAWQDHSAEHLAL